MGKIQPNASDCSVRYSGSLANSDEPSGKAPRAAHQTSQPEIRVAYTPAGRQTLDAITDELVPLPLPARTEREESSPEIDVRETIAERETLAAIIAEAAGVEEALGLGPAAPPLPAPASASTTDPLEIFEMITFVVRGIESAKLSSDALRRRFVEERLLRRLPVTSMDAVDRVDVTPWTVQGTLVVRVWCRSPHG
jgi:hypothetical protein